MTFPTARAIALHAEHLRFFSRYADLEAMIDRIPNGPPRTAEDEVNLIIRDGLIDLKLRMDPVIENLAKREAIAEAMEERAEEAA